MVQVFKGRPHADRAQAVRDAVDSLAPYLRKCSSEGIRDVQLIRSNVDLDDPVLESAILKFLTPDNEKYGLAEYRGLVLVGFNADQYPNTSKSVAVRDLLNSFAKSIEEWNTHLMSRLIQATVTDYELNVFLVPFPDVQKFRDDFLEAISP